MKYPALLIIFVLLCKSAFAGKYVLLENFDDPTLKFFEHIVKPEKVDIDEDGDMEGRFQAKGFGRIASLSFDREGKVEEVIKTFPHLRFSVAAIPDNNNAKWLSTMLCFSYHDQGDYLIAPVLESNLNIPKDGQVVQQSIDFMALSLKDGSTVKSLFERFHNGEIKGLRLAIVQQSPKGTENDCVYDDIRLSSEP